MVEGSLAENVQNLQFLLFQLLGTVFNISLFLEVLFFLCARDVFSRIQSIFENRSHRILQTTFEEKLTCIIKV